MIKSSLKFNYAGRDSDEFNIINCNIESGMVNEPFLSSREILEIKTRGRNKPYFQDVIEQPLTFKLSLAFSEVWDDDSIRETVKWLNQTYYQPLYFSDNEDRVFYCMPTGDLSLIHNCIKQGYIELTMRCDSPYSYTKEFVTEYFTV